MRRRCAIPRFIVLVFSVPLFPAASGHEAAEQSSWQAPYSPVCRKPAREEDICDALRASFSMLQTAKAELRPRHRAWRDAEVRRADDDEVSQGCNKVMSDAAVVLEAVLKLLDATGTDMFDRVSKAGRKTMLEAVKAHRGMPEGSASTFLLQLADQVVAEVQVLYLDVERLQPTLAF